MKRWLLLLTSLVFLLAACDGGSVERKIGVIESDSSLGEEVISAPDIVQAGTPFEVTVRTYGGGCIDPDGLEASVEENLAVLIPYDLYITPGRNEACPLIFEAEPHTTQLTFSEPGSATIRVEGRSESNTNVTGGAEYGEAVIEKAVQVDVRKVREVGVIELDDEALGDIIVVLEEVQAGEAFTVTVRTYGGGCTRDPDGVDVSIEGSVATLTPYDLRIVPGENSACPGDLGLLPHEAQLTFEEVGTATLRVEGRKFTDGLEGRAATEKTIRVE